MRDDLAETVRSHYGRLERIADDVERLGYKVAASILSEAMPQTPKRRSGDLGEILATELVEEEIGLRVPVRRLRYKDGRNIAMRGDDFIGAGYYGAGEKLWLLKGEAKSNKVLGKATVTSARKVLNRDNGRCTPDSLLFIANRLLESNDTDDNTLGRSLRDEVGLIREVVREFILDSMPIEPGTRLFGEVVEQRRRHSVATLAALKKLHRNTLNRAVVLTGLIPDGDLGKVDTHHFFDAVAGELLADLIHASIPVLTMPAYLNCNRRQAELLVQHGILSRLGGGQADTILNMVPIADFDAFIARMRQRGLPVDRPGDGMANVIAASEIVRWPVIDIVKLVLDDVLPRIELLSAELKFKSVLVDVEEVRNALKSRQAKGRLSVAEVAKCLNTETWCVRTLAVHHDRTGRPYLPASFETNTKGSARAYFEIDDLERFASAHVDLKALAEARGISAKALRRQLTDTGIEPILPRPKLNRFVYRRADL